MEYWNGNHHIDDLDDTLEPWDDPIVEQRIVNAIEKEDETTKLIAKARAEMMEWISQQTEEERQEEEAIEKESGDPTFDTTLNVFKSKVMMNPP